MIYVNFNLRNPKWGDRFKNIKCWAGETLIKHKYWEVQVIKCDNLFRFVFEFTTQQDHAGVNLELGIFGYEVHFIFYDNRHWNNENKCWEIYK
jgi:hypothetical protein